MLILEEDLTFDAPVRVDLAALPATFTATLKLLPWARIDEIQADLAEGKLTAAQFAADILVGWPEGEVKHRDGKPRAPTAENRALLLAQPGVPQALILAFWRGYGPAVEGNSEPLPAGASPAEAAATIPSTTA